MALDKLAVMNAISGIGQGYLAVQGRRKAEAEKARELSAKKVEADREYALKEMQALATKKYYEGQIESRDKAIAAKATQDMLSLQEKSRKTQISNYVKGVSLKTDEMKLQLEQLKAQKKDLESGEALDPAFDSSKLTSINNRIKAAEESIYKLEYTKNTMDQVINGQPEISLNEIVALTSNKIMDEIAGNVLNPSGKYEPKDMTEGVGKLYADQEKSARAKEFKAQQDANEAALKRDQKEKANTEDILRTPSAGGSNLGPELPASDFSPQLDNFGPRSGNPYETPTFFESGSRSNTMDQRLKSECLSSRTSGNIDIRPILLDYDHLLRTRSGRPS
jgi:hypothetical protein